MMDVREVCAALSNDTRLSLLSILIDDGPMTSADAHRKFIERYEDRRRQSIHSALETLAESGVLEKFYSKEDGGIVYEVRSPKLAINLDKMEVTLD